MSQGNLPQMGQSMLNFVNSGFSIVAVTEKFNALVSAAQEGLTNVLPPPGDMVATTSPSIAAGPSASLSV